MREDIPSATARAVALCRGIATLPARRAAPAPDPIAAQLIDPRLGRWLTRLEPWAERTPWVSRALRLSSLGLVDHIALRTAAIDAMLRAACERREAQVVLLGAGLDARAYRLDALAGHEVFEVDHPATQRFKRRRVASLRPVAAAVRFVPVDFTRDDLARRLDAAGHDAGRRTVWVWEGVVPYLPPEATRATLAALARRSGPGSALAVTYTTLQSLGGLARLSAAASLGFRVIGEPLKGMTTTAELKALLSSTGWSLREDSGPSEWRRRFDYGVSLPDVERLAIAEIE